MRRQPSAALGSVVLLWGLMATDHTARSYATQDRAEPRIISGYGKLPVHFEPNQGQTASDVNFLARGNGYSLFLSGTESTLALRKQDEGATSKLRFKLIGSNPAPGIAGKEELPGKSNYFIGNDPTRWRTNVAHYARVELADVYPGIDLAYYGKAGELEYDFVVKPGGDPRKIRFDVDGAENVRVDGDGNLILGMPGGDVVERAPLVYQEVDGVRRAVDGRFAMRGPREVGFEVGAYEPDRPLVVDPILVYSTYLGGSNSDYGRGIAVDSSGSAYVVGVTRSVNFPTANPMQAANAGGDYDAFVTKLSPSGTLVYSTYLGGGDGDAAAGIGVDVSGDAYITGITASRDFPTANPVQAAPGGATDIFVAKLNPSGSALLYSTYLGGNSTDQGQAIAIDAAGSAYITGITASTNFPTVGPIQGEIRGWLDAFVAKLNSSGSAILYSTYVGGTGADLAYGIAADASGNAYITGHTSSYDFPLANALQTAPSGAFVTKLNAAGSAFIYSTYLGGGGTAGGAVAADAVGNAYVVGATSAPGFPVVNAIQPVYGGGPSDAFVSKFNAVGSALVYSTFLGGVSREEALAVAVDGSGRAYVTGDADFGFPIVNAFQGRFGQGMGDAFIANLDETGSSLLYSSYLGGSGWEAGYGIAVDTVGSAYIAGSTESGDLRTVNPAQPTYGGLSDAFVAKIRDSGPWQLFLPTPCRIIDTANPPGPAGGPAVTANSTRTFQAAGLCGIPVTAKAVAVNITTSDQTDSGHLRVYAAGDPLPPTSTINFIVNQTRANNAIVALGTAGQIAVTCVMSPGSSGTTRLIVDVTGYFE